MFRREVGALRIRHCRYVTDPACAFIYGKATMARFQFEKCRHIEIGAQTDRIVHEAVRMMVERLFEPRFAIHSFGLRPGCGRQMALKHIKTRWYGLEWYLQFHIHHCVRSLSHYMLVKSLTSQIRDPALLSLIREISLYPGQEIGIRRNSLTPLLCNIYLNYLDKEVHRVMLANTTLKGERVGNPDRCSIKYIRYLDQLLLGIRGPQELVRHVRDHVSDYLKTNLRLHDFHVTYENITLVSPRFMGFNIEVRSPKMVRRDAKDMEKRRRCKVRIMKKREIDEGAYENQVCLKYQREWKSSARKALEVAEDAMNEVAGGGGGGAGEAVQQDLARLNKMVRDFFTTRRPHAQDQYMSRKYLNCLPTKDPD